MAGTSGSRKAEPSQGAYEVPPEDRLPTFAEVDGFDAGAAWDRLTPSQQREIGLLAVRFGTVGQVMSYVWNEIESNPPKGWTPYQIEAGNWPKDHIDRAATLSDQSFEDLCNAFDPVWPTLFGWVRPRWSKPVIREVA